MVDAFAIAARGTGHGARAGELRLECRMFAMPNAVHHHVIKTNCT